MPSRKVETWVLAASAVLIGLGAAPDEKDLTRQVGSRVGDFTLKDASSGGDISLFGFEGKKAAVLVFLGTDCPVGNLYLPRLAEMSRAYESKGVVFLGINANAHETADAIARHAKEFAIPFPVLKDDGAKVADQYKVARTCEAILLDSKAVVRYRGAIDDQYGYGTRRPHVVREYLSEAIDALLAEKAIETTGTTVVGCPIERPDFQAGLDIPKIRPASPEIVALLGAEDNVEVGPVSYASDVAEILQNKCQGCHRLGSAAPFSLLSYDHARRWAASIAEVVDDRRMPPWHADPRFGHFENDRRLSPNDRATLLAWVDQGMPLGDPKEIPPARAFPEGWVVGEPDLVFEMPEEFTVKPDGFLNYQYFRIPTNFTEDRWVQSIECLPGDRAVVHHIIAYGVDPKAPRDGERMDHLGGYAPGELPSVYSPGIAKKIAAGSEIVLQVHYTPMGKIRTDRSRVGLIFAKEPPRHEAITRGIANTRFRIPARDDDFEVKSKFKFGQDSHLLSFMPHMHLRGKDFKYEAVFPDGRRETLLSVPGYDFAWQSYYRLAEPMAMPKDTVIECLAHFDNSEGNRANPDPSKEVRWGDQTYEEMMIGYIDYYRDGEISPEKAPDPGKADEAKAPSVEN